MDKRKKLLILFGVSLFIIIVIITCIFLSKKPEYIIDEETNISNRRQVASGEEIIVESEETPGNPAEDITIDSFDPSQMEYDEVTTDENAGVENFFGSLVVDANPPDVEELCKDEKYPDYDMWLYDVYNTMEEYSADSTIQFAERVSSMNIYLNKSNKRLFYVLADNNGNKDIIYSKFIKRNNKLDIYTCYFVPINEYTKSIYADIVENCEKIGSFDENSSVIAYATGNNGYIDKKPFDCVSKITK